MFRLDKTSDCFKSLAPFEKLEEDEVSESVPVDQKQQEEEELSLTFIIGISTGGGFCLLFSIFLIVLHCERKRRLRRKLTEVVQVMEIDDGLNCQRDNKHPKPESSHAHVTPDLVFSSNITA